MSFVVRLRPNLHMAWSSLDLAPRCRDTRLNSKGVDRHTDELVADLPFTQSPLRCRKLRGPLHQLRRILDRMQNPSPQEEEGSRQNQGFRQVRSHIHVHTINLSDLLMKNHFSVMRENRSQLVHRLPPNTLPATTSTAFAPLSMALPAS